MRAFNVKIGEPIREIIATPDSLPIPGPLPKPPTPSEDPVPA